MGPIDSTIGNVTHQAKRWREAKRCSKQLGLPSVAHQSSLTFAPGTAGSVKTASTWRRPVVLLIGDSITEAGEDDEGGWSSKLGKAYRRKADVINRGFGGYNTDAAMFSLAEILDSLCKQQILIALLWLGANDAAVSDARDGAAHVPLDRYAANLHSLATQLQQAGVQHVVLVTPPPVWEDAPQAKEAGQDYPRTYNITSTYAAVVRTTAAKLQLPVLDVWRIFDHSPNWQQKLLAPDGLHLAKQGQLVVYQGFMHLVNQQLPQIRPSMLAWHHPSWRGLYTGNLSDRFAAEQAAYEAQFGLTEDCTPVDGLSTGFERAQWNSFSLVHKAPGKGIYNPQTVDAAQSGSFGATVLIHHSGRQPSDVQLLSVPAKLSNSSLYTLKVSAKANMLAILHVSLIHHSNQLPIYSSTAEVGHKFAVVATSDLQPPSSGLYLLALGLGAADAGTVFSFDNILLCAEDKQGSTEQLGKLLPASSSGFEDWSSIPFRGQLVSPADATFNLHAAGKSAKSGTFGASVFIKRQGEAAADMQLAGSQPVFLSASKSYIVTLSMQCIGPAWATAAAVLAASGTAEEQSSLAAVQVSFVEDNTWAATAVATLRPKGSSSGHLTYTLPPTSPPHDGSYSLSIDFGTMPVGTTLYFDDVQVFEVPLVAAQ
eukprot:gene13144-13274_t